MSLKKRITSVVAATAMGLALSCGTPNAAQASVVEDIVIIGIQGAQLHSQINSTIKYLNDTEEGRNKLYQQFREKYGVYEGGDYNATLDRIMANLTKAVAKVDSTINDKPYIYFISAQESVNAACSLGHVMMVNVGTFKKITNEDELAAIIGHEMAHGQKNHVAKANKKRINKAVVASMAGAAVGGGAFTSLVAGVVLNQSVAHGDRKFETEADLVGLDYMLHTDYNPGACAAVMQRFVEMEGDKKSASNVFNPADHPDSITRRDACAKKLFDYSGKHVSVKEGVVLVNNKPLMTGEASDDMSAIERAYFILGNLAVAYHNGLNKYDATVENGIVMLGNQPIVKPLYEDAQIIAQRLNAIK